MTPVTDTTPTDDSGAAAPDPLPAFLYDDCCPLCRGYTATFAALGWTDRQAFSSIDERTGAALDFDRARHHIPLVDPTTGAVRYGLDGIFGVVGERLPVLAPILANPAVRSGFEGIYWFITYNRRHIISAPPPVEGVNCAPDYRTAPIATYLALGGAAAATLAAASGTATAVAVPTALAAAVVARRRPMWRIEPAEAAGHVVSVAGAAAAAGAITAAIGAPPLLAGLAAAATGLRKVDRRRWMLRPPIRPVRRSVSRQVRTARAA